MNIDEYAYNRLKILLDELLREVPIIKGVKLSGSTADGHFFILQFGDIYISSDYDVVILLERYPEEREIDRIREILSKPVYNDVLEKVLLENMDVKLLSLEYPYKGRGVKTASIYDRDISIVRHLIGGKVVYGEEYFRRIVVEEEWIKRQLAYRVLERKKIFDLFTELGAYDRISTLLGLDNTVEKIRDIIRRYRDYHKVAPQQVESLLEECERIRREILEKISGE
jgi:hypothetical protein